MTLTQGKITFLMAYQHVLRLHKPLFLNHAPLPHDFLHDNTMTQLPPIHVVRDEIMVITWMHSSNQIRKITFSNPEMRGASFSW